MNLIKIFVMYCRDAYEKKIEKEAQQTQENEEASANWGCKYCQQLSVYFHYSQVIQDQIQPTVM